MKKHAFFIDICFGAVLIFSLFTTISVALTSKDIEISPKDDNLIVSRYLADNQGYKLVQNVIRNLDYLVITTHQVKSGEHIGSIAAKYGTTTDSLRSSNYLCSPAVRVGQKLIVSNKKGLVHKVKRWETLESIADKYHQTKDEIAEANGLIEFAKLETGMLIFIPNVKIYFPEFVSPFRGKISSGFGYRLHPIWGEKRFHDGIDITGTYRSPVRSTREGRVIFAGWKSGYGRLVMVKHPDGFVSYYGHLASWNVKSKQWVDKGQIIGRLGSSGWSTGPHLHFEIRRNGRVANPSRYMKQSMTIVSLEKEKK